MFRAQWKHSYYSQKEWTHCLQWQPACFAIWMMKLMYGSLVCAEQPQCFCQVMNSINTVGYWKRPGHTRSHLGSSFPFSIFGRSQINCIVFFFVLSSPSFLPRSSRPRRTPHSFCATFNELKGMQECTGKTWQSTFERLRLTNGTAVSAWLCLTSPFFSLHPSTRARGCGNEQCNRGEIRIGCELAWRLVCRLKMHENGRWNRSRKRLGDTWTMREGHS